MKCKTEFWTSALRLPHTARVVGSYLSPINRAVVLSVMLVEGLSRNWWLSAIAAFVAVAAIVVVRRRRS